MRRPAGGMGFKGARMLGISPIELAVIAGIGLLLLGPAGLAKVADQLRRAAPEIRATMQEATGALDLQPVRALESEIRLDALDGLGRPLASWGRVPLGLCAARLVDDTPHVDLDPTADTVDAAVETAA